LTEAGVAIPPAVSTSGLRELSPLLHQRGPAALVEAWALVSERVDGRPPRGRFAGYCWRPTCRRSLLRISRAGAARSRTSPIASRALGRSLVACGRERLPASSLQKLEALAREARQLANELDGLRPP
jgi:hypothetical protein